MFVFPIAPGEISHNTPSFGSKCDAQIDTIENPNLYASLEEFCSVVLKRGGLLGSLYTL